MDVQDTVNVRVGWQSHLWEVHRRSGGAVVAVLSQLLTYFFTDVFLSFHGRTTDVRGQDHVVEFAQW